MSASNKNPAFFPSAWELAVGRTQEVRDIALRAGDFQLYDRAEEVLKQLMPLMVSPAKEIREGEDLMAETRRTNQTAIAKKKEIPVADVIRYGDKMVLPENLTLKDAITILTHQLQYEEEVTGIVAEIDCFLGEGSWALFEACTEHFGWVRGIRTPPQGFFDPGHPPMMLSVAISRTETVQVPWGRMALPVVEGWLETDIQQRKRGGRFFFSIRGEVKRKYEKTVNLLIEDTIRRVKEDSIYKGKAFHIRFKDSDGDTVHDPSPTFINLDHAPRPEDLVFRDSISRQIETNLFTLITRTEDVKRAGVPLKRGVLLSGVFGTGKTLVAAATARLAEEYGWTFISCDRADEIAEVLRLAQRYGRAVVFCEDIDQVLAGERSLSMNDILNVIDGVDAKSSEILVVLTTNNVEKITQAMIRPGRIDVVVDMQPPDAKAAERLLRMYGRGLIPEAEDLTEVAEMLSGQIPSLIRDVVEESKIYAVSRVPPGEQIVVRAPALKDAVIAKQMQIALLETKKEDRRSDPEKAAGVIGEAIKEAITSLGSFAGNGKDSGVLPANRKETASEPVVMARHER